MLGYLLLMHLLQSLRQLIALMDRTWGRSNDRSWGRGTDLDVP